MISGHAHTSKMVYVVTKSSIVRDVCSTSYGPSILPELPMNPVEVYSTGI